MSSRPASPITAAIPVPTPGGLSPRVVEALLVSLILLLVGSLAFRDITAERAQQEQAIAQAAAADLPALLQTCITGGSPEKLSLEYDVALRYLAHQHHILSLTDFRRYLTEAAARDLSLSAPAKSAEKGTPQIHASQQLAQDLRALDLSASRLFIDPKFIRKYTASKTTRTSNDPAALPLEK
ncbi:MAG: hypothetical protein NTY98_02715, partial [Verrucomicrobia bacterium]|nr:hypothetical protein [Verrucomicrobiota bacterium]